MTVDEANTAEATHLSPETIAELEALLNEERRELIRPEPSPEEDTDLADDPGTRLNERQMLDTMSSLQTAQLVAVDHALERIKAGQYGSCEECGDEIPQERLEAIPTAVLCTACQSRVAG